DRRPFSMIHLKTLLHWKFSSVLQMNHLGLSLPSSGERPGQKRPSLNACIQTKFWPLSLEFSANRLLRFCSLNRLISHCQNLTILDAVNRRLSYRQNRRREAKDCELGLMLIQ